MKRVYIPRSLSVSRELTVPCQYTEFQKQGVKINTEGNRETCKFTSLFKRESQGKYEATLTFTIKGHKIYPKELCWIVGYGYVLQYIEQCHQVLLSKKFRSRKAQLPSIKKQIYFNIVQILKSQLKRHLTAIFTLLSCVVCIFIVTV